ncbi:NAD(P)-binding protein [Aspergillus tubingensis]|uniref:NAD(P)-binding protein n=1 Tax=Aspergillus tubingensis TaxID=5068 RepID=UPI00157A1A90|nr:NAD(P)-binding protein [Aspergillus tubingensis]GFN18374.1 NAD(P)-binding protein [Aspergillus tubingensis]
MLSRQVRAALLYPHLPTFGISGLRLPVGKPLCRVAISNFRRSMAGQAHVKERLPRSEKSHERFREFSLAGKVFAVTGGARGLGLSMAEALVEAGGRVYCLDRLPQPEEEFHAAEARANPDFGGSLHYRRMDVTDDANTEAVMADIAAQNNRLDGLVAAAGINYVASAIDHTPKSVDDVIHINYTGVFRSAVSAAKAMLNMKCHGSILLVASMSGIIANKGMESAVYNSSKAAVIQLTRSLAMEWSEVKKDGTGGIRVNCLCPGHIETPMAKMVMEKDPDTRDLWTSENMMKRLAKPEEFRGITLLLMSDASSFMTGSTVVVDGGHTAW